MVEPTTLMCGHSFCRPCLAQWYLKSGKRECPNCRQVDESVPKVNTVLSFSSSSSSSLVVAAATADSTATQSENKETRQYTFNLKSIQCTT
ncbi:Bifunctional apoptosis regulator [Lamellibrachia satsuma]|nr:Bifunctional apoptosis regulator [Lamellibrachia satsuma]